MSKSNTYRIGVSANFKRPDGEASFPAYDMTPIRTCPGVEVVDLALPPTRLLEPAHLEGLDAIILLGEKIDRKSFPADGRLKVISRMGVGYDTIDVPACTENDVALTIAPDGVRRPMAVAVMTMMLALTTRLFQKDQVCRGGAPVWPSKTNHIGLGLEGRTLASVGIGNIGAEVFRLAKPFGMRHIAHDPWANKAVAAELGIELVGLEDAFRQADVICFNCPLTPETRHIASRERIALMKPTAFLINTSRGPVVDQKALHDALVERRIAGAGIDVFDPEPPPADDPILKLDNIIVTPHALGFVDQMFERFGRINCQAVLDVRAGKEPANVVNREVLARPGWKAKLAGLAGA